MGIESTSAAYNQDKGPKLETLGKYNQEMKEVLVKLSNVESGDNHVTFDSFKKLFKETHPSLAYQEGIDNILFSFWEERVDEPMAKAREYIDDPQKPLVNTANELQRFKDEGLPFVNLALARGETTIKACYLLDNLINFLRRADLVLTKARSVKDEKVMKLMADAKAHYPAVSRGVLFAKAGKGSWYREYLQIQEKHHRRSLSLSQRAREAAQAVFKRLFIR